MKGKLWLLVSILCIALGLGLLLASGVRSGGDLKDVLSGAGYAQLPTEKTFEIDEPFRSVSVEESSTDVRLLPSSDGLCRVTCGETDRCTYTVTVEKDTLKVVREDHDSARLGFTLYSESLPLCVYLPEKSYEALTIRAGSGDVRTEPGFAFDRAEIGTDSGDVDLQGLTAEDLKISCSSGDIRLEDVKAGTLQAESTSGEQKLDRCSAGTLTLASTSGDVRLTDSVCDGAAKVGTASGEIRLRKLRAESFELSSNSGDVRGSVLGSVDFIVKTGSGDVRTKGGIRGGLPCRVTTGSGDVDLEARD